MAQRSSFADVKAEQARMTEDWKRMVAKAKPGLSPTRKLSKSFRLESPSVLKWDAVVTTTRRTHRTNGEEHFVRLWRRQLHWKRNFKEPARRCSIKGKFELESL